MYYKKDWVINYLNELNNEISKKYKNNKLKTLYIGGGTPSSLSFNELDILFKHIDKISFYKNYEFTGVANCHPDDQDMMSKLTGQVIAEMRATIKYLSFVRDCELRPQLKSLYQLYYSMNHSKYFDPKSYEAKMLYKQINILKEDLANTKIEINNIRKSLREYINQKEKDHKKIREYKQLAENNQ